MASEQSAVAFERLDEAADGSRSPAAAAVCDLAELASALAQAEALVSAGLDENPDAAAALERIADIAFVLHEREVERSLCDALDAAMREIGEANARNRASVQRAREAAELLRTLARRLDAMMAAQAQPQAAGLDHSSEVECADEFPASARLFDADVTEDGAFAQTVAALAQSLPERSDAAPAQLADQATDNRAAPEAPTHSDVEAESAEAIRGAGEEAASPAAVAATSAAVPLSEAAGLGSVASSVDAADARAVETHQSIDPDEDPGDLFEPLTTMPPAAEAPAPGRVMSAPPEAAAPPATHASQSPRAAADASAQAASRPVVTDPLAPIRALSEEELIALFS